MWILLKCHVSLFFLFKNWILPCWSSPIYQLINSENERNNHMNAQKHSILVITLNIFAGELNSGLHYLETINFCLVFFLWAHNGPNLTQLCNIGRCTIVRGTVYASASTSGQLWHFFGLCAQNAWAHVHGPTLE